MLEFEMKFMLSLEEYKVLCAAFHTPDYTQTNFYYDSDDLSYNQKGITCRIRKKGNNYQATIKTHRLNSKDCSEEITREVKDEYDISLFEGMHISLQGSMQTIRKNISMPNGNNIAIDRNVYLGTEDYELEIEYDPAFKNYCKETLETITDILSAQGLISSPEDFYNRRKYSHTKSERFYAQKSKKEEGASNAIRLE